MRQKSPYEDSQEERYGRHSNFRPQRDMAAPGFPVVKWLLLLFALVFLVLGYDRLRKHWQTSAVAAPAQPVASTLPPPKAAVEEEPLAQAEEPPAPPQEAPLGVETAVLAVATPAPPPKPAEEPAPAEKPETTVRYEMTMNRFNSFVGQGSINGVGVSLLADTGASMVVIPERLAQRIGLRKGAALAFKTGGGVVPHYLTNIDKLTLGQIEMRNIEAAINPAMQDDFVLLGMSALRFVDMERDTSHGKLVLKYKQVTVAAGELRTVEDESFKRSISDCKSKGNKFDQQTLDCLRGN